MYSIVYNGRAIKVPLAKVVMLFSVSVIVASLFIVLMEPCVANANKEGVTAPTPNKTALLKTDASLYPYLHFVESINYELSSSNRDNSTSILGEVKRDLFEHWLSQNTYKEIEYFKNNFNEDIEGINVMLSYVNDVYISNVAELLRNGDVTKAISNVDKALKIYSEFKISPLDEGRGVDNYSVNRILFYSMLMSDIQLYGNISELTKLLKTFESSTTNLTASNDNLPKQQLYAEYSKALLLFGRENYEDALTNFRDISLISSNPELSNLCYLMICRCLYWQWNKDRSNSRIQDTDELLETMSLFQRKIKRGTLWQDIEVYKADLRLNNEYIDDDILILLKRMSGPEKKDMIECIQETNQ